MNIFRMNKHEQKQTQTGADLILFLALGSETPIVTLTRVISSVQTINITPFDTMSFLTNDL